MKRFNIVFPRENGSLEIYPMKEWLRNNPNFIPPGLDATRSTSHQLRDGLRRMGWNIQESDVEVRLFSPDTNIPLAQLNSILGNPEDEIEETTEDENGEQKFALEYQLRDFLAENIQTILINNKRLRLFVDQTGRDGVEYQTDIGRIDILAVDNEGDFYVFELKRSRDSDKAIGQVSRYMGWVHNTIGRDKNIIGVIVAKSISERMKYAASVIPNIFLFEYKVEFHLTESNLIRG